MSELRVAGQGTWTYAQTAAMPVFIIEASFEFWYELARADATLEPGEEPDLNSDGLAFYVSFHGIRADGTFWPDSENFDSLHEAQAAAESRVPSPIAWLPR